MFIIARELSTGDRIALADHGFFVVVAMRYDEIDVIRMVLVGLYDGRKRLVDVRWDLPINVIEPADENP